MFTNHIFKISVLLLVLAVAFVTASFATHPTAVLSADRSYDNVEQARTTRPMTHIFSATYDQIETMRILRNSPNANASYDAIEQVRNGRGLSADRSYDALEQARTSRPFAFTVSASRYDMIEQLRLERELHADRTYDDIETLRLGR